MAEQPGRAIVYVYRHVPTPFSFGGYPGIYVNGEWKFDLKDKGYGVITLPPGQHEIKAEGSAGWWVLAPVTRTIAAEAGREYYVRIRRVILPNLETGQGSRIAEMIQIPKDEALKELSKNRLVTETDDTGR